MERVGSGSGEDAEADRDRVAREHRRDLNYRNLCAQRHSIYLLYWYKSTKY